MLLPSLYRPLFDTDTPPGGAPPADPPADPPATPPVETPPPAEPPADPPANPTQEDLNKAYAKLREAEKERDRLREAEKKREQEEMTELERANARIKEMEEQAERNLAAMRRTNLVSALRDPSLEIAPDAVSLVADKLDVDYNEDGEPLDVADAVKTFLEAHPSLKARPAGGGGPGSSPTNPAAGRSGGTPTMTQEEARRLAKENPVRFNEMWEAGEIPASALGG